MQRHKIPVHLETPDTLLFGLTARQTAVVGIGIALAYITVSTFWHDTILLGVAITFGALIVIASLLVAFVKPKNRTLDAWVVVMVNYWMIPHFYAWRPLPPDAVSERSEARRVVQGSDEEE